MKRRWLKDLVSPIRVIGWYSFGVGNGTHDRWWIAFALCALASAIFLEWRDQKENPSE